MIEEEDKMKDKYLLDCIQTYKRRLVWSIQADNRCKMQEKILTFQMYKNFLLFGKQYEKKWRRLQKKYNKVNMIGVEFVSFGETLPRLFTMLQDFGREDKRVLNVVLPIFCEAHIGGIHNKRIFDMFERHLYFVRESNIDFWAYVVSNHAESINKKYFYKYNARRPEYISVKLGIPLLPFTNEQVREAEAKMKHMGIKGGFVCLHSRENRVKELEWNVNLLGKTSCRDCDINSFGKASLYMENLGYQSIRMGKYEVKKCSIPGVIDYSNNYYDELMDFYLLSKCKFLIGSDSGLSTSAGFWGRPVLITNVVPICYGFESCPNTGVDMYIPKKFWSEKEKRYLNLYEMLDISNDCDIYDSRYQKRRIVLEDNTQDEILEATKEMNAKLDGCWVTSKEEEADRKQYWRIMDLWKKNHSYVLPRRKYRGYVMLFQEISYSYLKNNRYLLDVDF